MALILLLLLSFSLFLSKSPLAASLSGDVISLLAFKTSLSRDSLNRLSNWNPTGNHCNWYGVVCDRISGRVVTISLPGGGLAGTLPPSIGNLTELRTLSLPHNVFSGEIPSEIRDLKYLETLELQGNNFSGSIPHQIRYLSSLRLLNFSHNSLSGSIPDDLIGLRRLGALDLSNNQLSSDIQVSKSHSCEFLNHLKLSNNYLIGNIPADIGKCINLRTFLVDGNIIEGQIPPEIGLIRQLRVLDVSRNSLTDGIPRELGNCKELSVVVLTNLVDFRSDSTGAGGEFNAFEGGIPQEVLLLPNLQIFWAPRANLGGGLNSNWNDSCSLRVLNLGQNYLSGLLPHSLEMCKYLTFLDLSSNGLQGEVPLKLQVPCMVHFNVSRNSLSGSFPRFPDTTCDTSLISFGRDAKFLDDEDIRVAYSNIPVWGTPASNLDAHLLVVHDFSWNDLFGTLPLLSFKNQFFLKVGKISYKLLMNNNRFNGSLPDQLFSNCSYLHSFSANLSVNQVSGALRPEMFVNCLPLTSFEAAQNHIGGSIPPEIGNLKMLKLLDFSRNSLSGAMPVQLGDCKDLEWINLGENNLSGAIPDQLGQLTSLQAVLLDHNNLSGEIPISFSTLPNLITLDLSFNNLSGHIPHLQHANDCDSYRGNKLLSSCPDSNASPTGLPTPLEVHNLHNRRKLKSLVIAISTAVSIVALILAVVVLVLFMGRRRQRLSKLSSLRRKMVVTFAETPVELNYDNVVGATGNFSIRNLIGTGGFGSTYKAELVPGFLVAVKRLSLGRFQGIQQFEAEIRTLGRIRHKNLVTLIGYYVGENEMFLVYNYLSGGNLESFIHERSGKNVEWPVIHKIAIDIARSLAFLHYSCVPRIVHRDIKPSNILLDEDCNAYLSDFGLARLLEVSETHATTDVAGTFGYVAPEYATTCRVSDKADVYSFGVVLLELMSGKKSLDPSFSEYGNGFNIVTWAKLLIKEGRYSELFAPQLWEAGPQEDLLGMMKLASTCTVESPLSVRPTMKQVLEKLKQLSST